MVLTVLFIFAIFLIFIWRDTRKPEKFPPGPKWLPVIGCIPLIQALLDTYKFYHLVWQHFSQCYGPVVGFRIGRDKLIVVSGREAIKEFYSREEWNGRPNGFFFRMRSFNKRLGIVFTDGQFWEVQKKFSQRTLKQLGNSQYAMVGHIQGEAEEMIEYFQAKAKKGQLITMNDAFDIPVLNVMWALLAGFRFHPEDERLLTLLKMIHESFRIIDMSGGILNQFPFVRYIFPYKSGYRPLLNNLKPMWSFLSETIEEIRGRIDFAEPKSLIEAFLVEIQKPSDESSTFTSEQLLSLCLDFFQAGSETTSNTLGFGIIYMLHNPTVLKKVRTEILNVIGKDRLPRLSDRQHMPYTEAVLCEIQRFASVAPLAIAHRTTEKTKFFGYSIPKDTLALVSLYSLNMDASYWKDPQVFRPERFLDEHGKLTQHDAFINFGLGKRRCIGEALARSSLFLFFSAFVQCFDVVLPVGDPLPAIEGLDGITLSPIPYKAYLKIRHH